MTNEITINPDDILCLADNSITDYETIRQISLLGYSPLYSKINKEFVYCGLYPHVMKSFNTDDRIRDWEKKQEREAFNIRNLIESFEWMKDNVKDYQILIETNEEDAIIACHHGLGQWLRNNLGFWQDLNKPYEEKRPLVRWFNDIGIYHPDDMSSILVISWHRMLSNKDVKLDEQVKHYRDYWNENHPSVNEGIV